MTLTEEMELLGADVADAMKRFSGKTAFYERMLKKLPASVEVNPVLSIIEQATMRRRPQTRIR